jgi:prephenate dehydratase
VTRAAYLGPPGTNSHDALVAAGVDVEPVALPSVPAVVRAVQDGSVERGLVPVENSREGSVAATLDALVFDAPDVVIVGELVHGVTYCLAGAEPIAPDEVRTVHSHPQALGQCAAFLREQLPGAALVAEPSTADAVRAVAEGGDLAGAEPHAAIGTRQAARLYGATVLAEGIEDDPENETRFAWLGRAPAASAPPTPAAPPAASPAAPPDSAAAPSAAAFKTALVFWGGGDLQPGWLVACLTEFSSRGISLTRIESRPRRIGLGHYMFFCDLAGPASNPDVAAAIGGLRAHCESVRVLGSFPVAA